MATVLLSTMGAALCGCLIPQDEPVLPDPLPKRNSPPKIVAFQPAQQVTEISLNGSCPRPKFEIDVRDDDTTDLLQTLWWVDPNQVLFGETSRSGKDVTRKISQPSSLGNILATLGDGNQHVVQVVVTDGNFLDEKTPSAVALPNPVTVTLPDGGTLSDVAYYDSFSWFVKVVPCP